MDAIEFHLNGDRVSLTRLAPTTTFLNWLRYDRGLTGTKEGCAEGDCGACTVAMRSPDGEWQPVCACILLIGMAHGREIRTIEALASDGLHPIQQAMADGHGTQCGFCTPGIVMSLWTAGQNGALSDRAQVRDALSGNLCRCTGYGPIIDAALSVDWSGASSDARSRDPAGPLAYSHGAQDFWSPTSTDDLASLISEHPDATVLSGATDVGLWVTKQDFNPDKIIYTGRVADLSTISQTSETLHIGAGATYCAAAQALADLHPDLAPLIRRIGGAQVRAMGTIGGNIANGSPIGDMPPALIVAGATVHLRRGDEQRALPLEDFFIDYGQQDLGRGEFVEAIDVPIPRKPSTLACYKIAKRYDQDISSVLGCFAIERNEGIVTKARIAFGGMAGVPKRAEAAEATLIGASWTLPAVESAMRALAEDFQPLSDHRASADYRLNVARNLLLRYFLAQTEPHAATELPADPIAVP